MSKKEKFIRTIRVSLTIDSATKPEWFDLLSKVGSGRARSNIIGEHLTLPSERVLENFRNSPVHEGPLRNNSSKETSPQTQKSRVDIPVAASARPANSVQIKKVSALSVLPVVIKTPLARTTTTSTPVPVVMTVRPVAPALVVPVYEEQEAVPPTLPVVRTQQVQPQQPQQSRMSKVSAVQETPVDRRIDPRPQQSQQRQERQTETPEPQSKNNRPLQQQVQPARGRQVLAQNTISNESAAKPARRSGGMAALLRGKGLI